MTIHIVTDGTVDLPQESVEAYGIDIVPVSVVIDGEILRSRIDISIEEFYQRQRTAKTLPSTSLPTPGQFMESFEAALESHDQILCICISSGLSGTLNSARQAASAFPEGKIVLHDSLTLSGALGFQVIAAARVAGEGGSMEDALAAVRQTQAATELYFSVDDLTYLIKGGRIGRVAGTVGSFLNIKPVITVDKKDGIYSPVARVRSFKATMKKMVDLAANVVPEGQPGRFMVLHGEMEEEAADVEAQLRERFDVRWLYTTRIAPALGAHTGPRGLGLVVAQGDWD
jgi:DegV family protein with EDD domain